MVDIDGQVRSTAGLAGPSVSTIVISVLVDSRSYNLWS